MFRFSEHALFAQSAFELLPERFLRMEVNKPWIIYWSVCSNLLVNSVSSRKFLLEKSSEIINALVELQKDGFCGNRQCDGHTAPSFAAVSVLQMFQAVQKIDKEKIKKFLEKMKNDDGSISLYENGESDVRGAYCAIVCDYHLKLGIDFSLTTEWILKCQNYDGGFGGTIRDESHGGYTFCALASLKILGELNRVDSKVKRWIGRRQIDGFNGRTNKLGDSCYSYWVGGAARIVGLEFDRNLLREFLGKVAQQPVIDVYNAYPVFRGGGFRDREGGPDYYHTCYSLMGLSLMGEEGMGEFLSEFGIEKNNGLY